MKPQKVTTTASKVWINKLTQQKAGFFFHEKIFNIVLFSNTEIVLFLFHFIFKQGIEMNYILWKSDVESSKQDQTELDSKQKMCTLLSIFILVCSMLWIMQTIVSEIYLCSCLNKKGKKKALHSFLLIAFFGVKKHDSTPVLLLKMSRKLSAYEHLVCNNT